MKSTIHSIKPVVLALVFFCLATAQPIAAADQPDNPAQRWSKNGAGGTPSFTKHIVPLLTKAGCNNRSCHGSFQGKGGFRLSLFGYEPLLDHRALTADKASLRVDTKDADKSLAILKPLLKIPHKGKKRFEEGSWQHRMFRQWIADGAVYDRRKKVSLERLEIIPGDLYLMNKKSVQLRTIAHYADGSREDVTPLALFESKDESVVRVSEDGVVSVAGTGSTALVVKFSSGIANAQVIVPRIAAKAFPEFPPNNNVDVLAAAKLRKLGIRPSDLSTDEAFLRRVYVDAIGTLPTADEVRAFLNDKRPDKRERIIDHLLARPEYSIYWATLFSDWLGNNQSNINNFFKMTNLFHDWLRDKLERNLPYDEFVRGVVTATSREGRPLVEYLAENKTVAANIKPRTGFDDGTYAKRKTLDLFWLRRVPDRPKELAIRTANAFLGVQIQCAECHNHPFDRWTKNDFEGFTSIFRTVDICDLDGSERSGRRYDYHLVALYPGIPKRNRGLVQRYPPKILGGAEAPYTKGGVDPRVKLWEWMKSRDNPYFARNIVNRLWHHYFGTGIVDPVDDLNEANPPSNPELLNWLARDFIDHGFDLKHLHRRILASRTYQLSHRPNDTNRTDKRHFSHALVRRMSAEVALDAIVQVTGTTLRFNNYSVRPGTRAIGVATPVRIGKSDYFLQIFGKPKRMQTCACERSNNAALAQALFLINDEDIHTRVESADGRLGKLIAGIRDDRKLIEELYLTCLSRYPRSDETQKILAYVQRADSRREAMQDVLWSLINVREFLFVR